MTTLLAPPPPTLVSAALEARPRRKSRLLPALMWLGVLVCVGLLVAELCAADPAAMLRTLHVGWLAVALAGTAVSLLAAAQPRRVRDYLSA